MDLREAMQMTFEAVLEVLGTGVSGAIWVAARVPFEPAKVWAKRSGMRVKGTIRAAGEARGNAALQAEPFQFATSLMKSSEFGYFMLVNAKMRKAVGGGPGALVEIVLEPDPEGEAATPPRELAKLLMADRRLKKWFESLSYSVRKSIAIEVAESQSAEVRQRRAELWVERIMQVMEGEESPPPVLQAAFRRQPLAREGWGQMTPNRRRMNLWGIVYCQSPEAQAKRVEKAIAEALMKVQRVRTDGPDQSES